MPDRHALTAHGFRELLDHLAEHADIALGAKPQSLNQLVKAVIEARNAKVKTGLAAKDGWSLAEQRTVRRFLATFVSFEAEVDQIAPKRRDRQRQVVEALDPSPLPTPAEAVDAFFYEWQRLTTGFNNVAHHSDDGAGLAEWIMQAEHFLLTYLLPEPIPRRKEILDLIKKGGTSA